MLKKITNKQVKWFIFLGICVGCFYLYTLWPQPLTDNLEADELVLELIQEHAEYGGGIGSTTKWGYKFMNVDEDVEEELVAFTQGAVHLGTLLIFDDVDNNYVFIEEKGWNVVDIKEVVPLVENENMKLFYAPNHTGGTGYHAEIGYMWYVKNGKIVEAWSGILKEEEYFQHHVQFKIGAFTMNESTSELYYWLTSTQQSYSTQDIEERELQPAVTTSSVYDFNGGVFIQQNE